METLLIVVGLILLSPFLLKSIDKSYKSFKETSMGEDLKKLLD